MGTQDCIQSARGTGDNLGLAAASGGEGAVWAEPLTCRSEMTPGAGVRNELKLLDTQLMSGITGWGRKTHTFGVRSTVGKNRSESKGKQRGQEALQ